MTPLPDHGEDGYRLCYVDDDWAFFTNLSLDDQWGDDWNDAPYEHNAGLPYVEDAGQILVLGYRDADVILPRYGVFNSSWSVEDINRKQAMPWFRHWDDETIALWAGASPAEFAAYIERAGGRVYVEAKASAIGGRADG